MTSQSHLTPYGDEYPTCLETRASLRIYPGARHPDEVTALLHTAPTSIKVAGEAVTNRRGLTRIIRTNGWFLSSEGHVVSKDLRRHLDWLLEQLVPARAGLMALQRETDVRMSVNCVWWSRSGHGGPTLWPAQMRALVDLDLECSFDVYFFGED